MKKLRLIILFICVFIFIINNSFAISNNPDAYKNDIYSLIEKAKIPGISMIIVKDTSTYFYNYGYSDLDKKTPVNLNTIFELASCSKSFTALGILKLAKEKKINLTDSVSKFLPWFKASYKGEIQEIQINHLLYQSSGISWKTLSYISTDSSAQALENTIKKLSGTGLTDIPGKKFEYATINYDILGLIIEKVSGRSFEDFMQIEIFTPMGLNSTYTGQSCDKNEKSKGYKISFFKPKEFQSPIFKGNNPAAYIHSSPTDIARWLKIQMGIINTGFDTIVDISHKRDETVPPLKHNLNSYAAGWHVSLNGDDIIWHDGLNPNFTSYMAFSKKAKVGVAVLANSNSDYTKEIGEYTIKKLSGDKYTVDLKSANKNDKLFSVLFIISLILTGSALFYLITIITGIINNTRKKTNLTGREIVKYIMSLLITIPFFYCIFLIPKALAGFDWPTALIWVSLSMKYFALCFAAAILLGVITYVLSSVYQLSNIYKNSAPYLITLSLFSGISNMFIIVFITSAVNSEPDIKYTLLYFALVFLIYIGGRKIVQTKLIKFTMDIIYDLRLNLIRKVFSTQYQDFEKLEKGRIYSTLNDDTIRMGDAANIFVAIITSVVTILGGFIFLATLAFWATLITIGAVIAISTTYYLASKSATPDFEKARDTQNVFMKLVNGMVEGFKELNLHNSKKVLYKEEIEDITDTYRSKLITARIKFVNAFLIGESLLIIILATVAYAFPSVFPDIKKYIIMNFIIVLLYLIGPFNVILNSIPVLMQIKVSWNRINQFLKEIPSREMSKHAEDVNYSKLIINNVKIENIAFKYNSTDQDQFKVGPVSFEVNSGEILFIIGGNGSGKTTLLKLLTGLYSNDEGTIKMNGKEIYPGQLGEYYSVIFNPHYLFERLYDIDSINKDKEISSYLNLLNLQDKVNIVDGHFSSLNLSTGQRKRMALMQSFLEAKPVYIFDEWAADQDPAYRKLFYEQLLINMKKEGKIVIAITHDDNYFHVADKIMKMNRGQVEFIQNKAAVNNV